MFQVTGYHDECFMGAENVYSVFLEQSVLPYLPIRLVWSVLLITGRIMHGTLSFAYTCVVFEVTSLHITHNLARGCFECTL
jgi:hypothetical protein